MNRLAEKSAFFSGGNMSDFDVNKLLQELEEAEKRQGKIIPDAEVARVRKERGVSRFVREFIQDKEIVSGDDKVPNYLIYQTYLEHKSHTPKESKVEFFRQFNKLFTAKRSAKVRNYMLDSRSFDMSTENLERVKEIDDDRRKK